MSRRLSYKFDCEKFVAATVFLTRHCPDVTKMKLAKLLYYADKEHLLRYGRPVIGDTYIKMEHGPVPSKGYNLVKHDDRALREDQELFDDFISVQGNDIRARVDADIEVLSDSDIEVLESIVLQYGKMTASQLRTLSHREAAWKSAEDNADMDYRLCFSGRPDARSIWDLAQSDQELRDAIGNVEFEEFNSVAL